MMKYLLPFLFIGSAFAADRSQVQVQGSCDLRVVPDRGSVTFVAQHQSKKQKEAFEKTAKQLEALRAQLEGLKLAAPEFKTTDYTVTPVREYERNRMVDKGTMVSASLQVTTSDISRLSEAMSAASKLDFNNVGSLETFLSEKLQKETYLKCLDLAAQDAKDKGQRLAKKLGFNLGDVIGVVESPQVPQGPSFPERAMFKGGAADAAVAVDAGEQKFSTTLLVTFGIQ